MCVQWEESTSQCCRSRGDTGSVPESGGPLEGSSTYQVCNAGRRSLVGYSHGAKGVDTTEPHTHFITPLIIDEIVLYSPS